MKKSLLFITTLIIACHADVQSANQQAREFIKRLPGATDVVCNDSDSDGDGYVSCTVFRGQQDPLAISCGAENWCAFNCAKGCKLMPYVGASKKSTWRGGDQ
jgi:hypothetical protein